jgi:hypothetical protein
LAPLLQAPFRHRHTRSAQAAAVGGALNGWWVAITIAGALVMTLFDAALLQRRRSFFTGGFLSVDHLNTPGEFAAFALGSFMADAAVVGLVAALVLRLTSRFRVRPLAGGFLALSLALAPLVVSNFLTYQLVTHLGDAFDLALMFELSGRSPGEILAVSWSHLITPAVLIVSGAALVGISAWVLHRMGARSPAWPGSNPAAMIGPALAIVFLGTTITTGMRLNNDALENGLRRKPSAGFLGSIVEKVTDVDRDGYGLLSRPADPDPWDARIYPYAVDIPGNGIDENGVGGDLPADLPRYAEGSADPPAWRSTPHVVFVVLESFRADLVGAVHNGRPVTPVLDQLAARGVAASVAYSHNGYTVQSRHHLLAGSLANLRGGTTLIDDFKANGYEVAYFSAQDESFGSDELRVGFDRADVAYDARQDRARRYSTFTTPGSLAVPYGVLLERLQAYLDTRASTRPLFLYVNFHDTHFPYHHPDVEPLIDSTVISRGQIRPRRAEALRAMYRNTASNVDQAVGTALRMVRQALDEEPAILVTADHGESLFEEGFLGHGYALNEVQTRIPLIAVNLPIVIEEPFGQADLRDAIREALTREPRAARPVLLERPERRVFQYLGGNVDRPRQIGWVGLHGRTTYDFRSGRVRIDSRPWQPPDTLNASEHQRFLELVWLWERMILARAEARDGT